MIVKTFYFDTLLVFMTFAASMVGIIFVMKSLAENVQFLCNLKPFVLVIFSVPSLLANSSRHRFQIFKSTKKCWCKIQ